MKTLKQKLWSVFSVFIRLRDADKFGVCACISCGVRLRWSLMQAGHYEPKSAGMGLYFNEDDVHAQCEDCNVRLRGNHENYRIGLIAKIGLERVERLEKLKYQVAPEKIDYKKLTEYYAGKVDVLFNNL